jgi:hypothetical protein
MEACFFLPLRHSPYLRLPQDPPSSSTMATTVPSLLPFSLHNRLTVVCFFVFSASKSMFSGERWMNYIRCAALEIAAAELRKIQDTCSCHLPLKNLGHLFHAEDDLEDFPDLDCKEGIGSSSRQGCHNGRS